MLEQFKKEKKSLAGGRRLWTAIQVPLPAGVSKKDNSHASEAYFKEAFEAVTSALIIRVQCFTKCTEKSMNLSGMSQVVVA